MFYPTRCYTSFLNHSKVLPQFHIKHLKQSGAGKNQKIAVDQAFHLIDGLLHLEAEVSVNLTVFAIICNGLSYMQLWTDWDVFDDHITASKQFGMMQVMYPWLCLSKDNLHNAKNCNFNEQYIQAVKHFLG